MKKILLGTTGLVGAALLATAASAETPKVTLGGFSDFQAGWTDNDAAPAVGDSDVGFRNDNEITVHVDGKTDGGLGYGAVIDLEADLNADTNNEGVNASRTFTYLEGTWGRVEMGGNKSAASTMRVDASTVAVATGGINGDWVHFVNPSGANTNPGNTVAGTAGAFISNSELQSEHGSVETLDDETTYNNTKITYYSPRWAGFQFGASYTPDINDKGQLAQRLDDDYSDVIDLGLGYETQFDGGWKLALSGTYETADSDTAGTDDLEGWNIGALVGWDAFSIAGSYGNWDEGAFGGVAAGLSTVTPIASADGDYWTAGVGYDAGAFGLSATYLDSSLDIGAGDNDFTNLVLGADYKLAPGLTPYVEASFYDFDSTVAAADNEGTTVIVGTQLAF
jgi:hypothetical protein